MRKNKNIQTKFSGGRAETHQTTNDPARTLRTNQGIPIADNQNSLKAGPRGPILLEDFVLREKITHFDHERIPERIVHARGTGAHGALCKRFTNKTPKERNTMNQQESKMVDWRK